MEKTILPVCLVIWMTCETKVYPINHSLSPPVSMVSVIEPTKNRGQVRPLRKTLGPHVTLSANRRWESGLEKLVCVFMAPIPNDDWLTRSHGARVFSFRLGETLRASSTICATVFVKSCLGASVAIIFV